MPRCRLLFGHDRHVRRGLRQPRKNDRLGGVICCRYRGLVLLGVDLEAAAVNDARGAARLDGSGDHDF